MRDVIVVGAGTFGLSAALALRAAGHRVTVLDPGPIPHPRAASTDLSKAVRADYGRDDFYMDWMLEALPRWRAWNARWARPLFHETGVAFLSGGVGAGFEHESAARFEARGLSVERLDGAGIARRFPQWAKNRFESGYFNPLGGWAESGEVVAALARDAAAAGIEVRGEVPVLAIHDDGAGVDTPTGSLRADAVVVAGGAWTPKLVPELAPACARAVAKQSERAQKPASGAERRGNPPDSLTFSATDAMRSTAQTIFLLRPEDPTPWVGARHPMFGADISQTGWYGFPIHPTGLLKIAHHGDGWALDPDAPREAPAHFVQRFRDFLARDLPSLVDAPLVEARVCLYCDTFDGDFWIDRSPQRPALIVASGGSGHGFKFAPVLGDVVVSVLDDLPHPARERFRWRTPTERAKEDARAIGEPQ